MNMKGSTVRLNLHRERAVAEELTFILYVKVKWEVWFQTSCSLVPWTECILAIGRIFFSLLSSQFNSTLKFHFMVQSEVQ